MNTIFQSTDVLISTETHILVIWYIFTEITPEQNDDK